MGIAFSAGCGKKPDAEFPTWAPQPTAYAPQTGGGNAYDDYVAAAQDAERSGGSNLDRVNFFPGHKKAAEHDLATSVTRATEGTRKPCTVEFVPQKPFDTQPNIRGWRLIGRVYAWKVEDDCKVGNFDQAISEAVTGSRFGFDLTGGGAVQASLGLGIVDDIRRVLANYLPNLTAVQSETLAAGMTAALARKPATQLTVLNEKQNLLLGVQTIQDLFRQDQWTEMETNFGSSAKDGLDYLRSLKGETLKRTEYFNGFAEEAVKTADWAAKSASQPTKDRVAITLAKDRPWRRLSRNLFGTLAPLLAMEDMTIARTRLLIVNAHLQAMAKRKTPPTLSGIDASVASDPYSGEPFILHSDGTEFLVYSVGENLKDDGGAADESFTKPDLMLEQSALGN